MGGLREVIRKARTCRCNRCNSATNITLSGNQVAEIAAGGGAGRRHATRRGRAVVDRCLAAPRRPATCSALAELSHPAPSVHRGATWQTSCLQEARSLVTEVLARLRDAPEPPRLGRLWARFDPEYRGEQPVHPDRAFWAASRCAGSGRRSLPACPTSRPSCSARRTRRHRVGRVALAGTRTDGTRLEMRGSPSSAFATTALSGVGCTWRTLKVARGSTRPCSTWPAGPSSPPRLRSGLTDDRCCVKGALGVFVACGGRPPLLLRCVRIGRWLPLSAGNRRRVARVAPRQGRRGPVVVRLPIARLVRCPCSASPGVVAARRLGPATGGRERARSGGRRRAAGRRQPSGSARIPAATGWSYR